MVYRRCINLFRIIISSLDSPLYNLTTFLHKILIKNIPVTDSHLNNSFDLVQKLKDVQINDDYILISLDVISLLLTSLWFGYWECVQEVATFK